MKRSARSNEYEVYDIGTKNKDRLLISINGIQIKILGKGVEQSFLEWLEFHDNELEKDWIKAFLDLEVWMKTRGFKVRFGFEKKKFSNIIDGLLFKLFLPALRFTRDHSLWYLLER